LVSRCRSLPADSLQLSPDGQLAFFHVDVVPGEPESLALAKAEGKNQDIRRVERIPAVAGRFEEIVDWQQRPTEQQRLALRPGGVLALRTALTGPGHLVDPRLNIPRGQPV
jgi:hypothetical protein